MVKVRWEPRYPASNSEYVFTCHLFNSNNFMGSGVLADICALLSVILVISAFIQIYHCFSESLSVLFLLCLYPIFGSLTVSQRILFISS